MNVVELAKFKSFILDLQISPFDNSSDCAIVLTRNQLIIGFLAPTKDLKWTMFKEIDMKNNTTAFAISPLSRTILMPLLIRVAYADNCGIYVLSFVEDSLQNKQTIYKGNFEVTTMSYSDDGMRLAFAGYDNRCHILVYQDDALSEPDSIVSADAVSEGSYHRCSVSLTSPAVSVRWHPTRNNYLVVAEMNGTIRFLMSSVGGGSGGDDDDERESFTCEYVINIGLQMRAPLTDIDIIAGGSCHNSNFDFVASSAAGLFLFALDKPQSSLERLRALTGGIARVAISRSWGRGSLLATVASDGQPQHQHQLSVTDLAGSRVIGCPLALPAVAISWHCTRPILMAASIDALVAIEFHEWR